MEQSKLSNTDPNYTKLSSAITTQNEYITKLGAGFDDITSKIAELDQKIKSVEQFLKNDMRNKLTNNEDVLEERGLVPRLLSKYIQDNYTETDNMSDYVRIAEVRDGFTKYLQGINKDIVINNKDFTTIMRYCMGYKSVKKGSYMVYHRIRNK